MSVDGPSGTDGDADSSDERGAGDLLEDVVTVASALLIVGVLAYLVSQAAVDPAAPEPTASVESVEPFRPDGEVTERVRVRVGLSNRGGTGLGSVEVVVRCGDLERSLVFEHVPARGNRTGTVVCPQGTDPTASVAAWVEA